ncbi:MAG: hypothetical protein Q8J97_10455 [Flavobacteriaceae bacterium]|nr:hypothetical protein [Flavobacteriaceae bacterium]
MSDLDSIKNSTLLMGLLLISFFSAFSQERKIEKDSVYKNVIFKPSVSEDIKTVKSQTNSNTYYIADKSKRKVSMTEKDFYDDTTDKLNKNVVLPNKGKNKFDELSLLDKQIYMMRVDFLSLIVYSFNGKLKRYKNLKKLMEFDEKVFALKKNYYAGYFKIAYGIEENQLNAFLDYCTKDEKFKAFLRKDFDQLKLMEFFQVKAKTFLELNTPEE